MLYVLLFRYGLLPEQVGKVALTEMCLSANEPGGPRRCTSYMRNVHALVVQLQQNEEAQASKRDLIEDTNRIIHRIENVDTQYMSEGDKNALERQLNAARTNVNNQNLKLQELEDAHPRLRKSAMTALKSHEEEVERRHRMGWVMKEEEDAGFDPNKPFVTVSAANLHYLEENAQKEGKHFYRRGRLIPVQLGDGRYHPYLTVREMDVQFDNPEDGNRYSEDPGRAKAHEDRSEWYAPTDKVMQAALEITNGGEHYVAQRNATEETPPTGNIVRDAVYLDRTGRYVTDTSEEAKDFLKFARKFPGDNSFAQAVRKASAAHEVKGSDVALLSSAVVEWKKYKDRHNPAAATPETNGSAPAPLRKQQNKASAPTKAAPKRSDAGWVGEVGSAMPETSVTLKYVRKFDSDFGGKLTLLIAEDEQGHTYKWRASNDLPIQRGDVISLRGRIEDHEDYNGTKQTVIKNGQFDVLSRVTTGK